MSSQEQSPILRACAEIFAQIEKITASLGTAELNTDEIRAIGRCETEISKLDTKAWGILCDLMDSDQLDEETAETVQAVDDKIDGLNAIVHEVRPKEPRSYTNDFGFGIHGVDLGG